MTTCYKIAQILSLVFPIALAACSSLPGTRETNVTDTGIGQTSVSAKSDRLVGNCSVKHAWPTEPDYGPLADEARISPQLSLALKQRNYSWVWEAVTVASTETAFPIRYSESEIPTAHGEDYRPVTEQCLAEYAKSTGGKIRFDFSVDPNSNDGKSFGFTVEGNGQFLAKKDPRYRERYHVRVLVVPLGGKSQSIMLLDEASVAYWDVDNGSEPDISKFEALALSDEGNARKLADQLNSLLSDCLRKRHQASFK